MSISQIALMRHLLLVPAAGSSTATRAHVVGTPTGVSTHLESSAKGSAPTACSEDTEMGWAGKKYQNTQFKQKTLIFLQDKAMLPAGNKSSSIAGTQGMSQRGFSACRHWSCSCSRQGLLFPCLEQKIPAAVRASGPSPGSSICSPFPGDEAAGGEDSRAGWTGLGATWGLDRDDLQGPFQPKAPGILCSQTRQGRLMPWHSCGFQQPGWSHLPSP